MLYPCYRNPDDELPTDFTAHHTAHYHALNQPLDPDTYIEDSQRQDVLKETNLRVGFADFFTGTGTRTVMGRETLQRRLLLALFGLGTNAEFKRVCTTTDGEPYQDLLDIRRRYLHPDALRNAIAHVASAIFRVRSAHIWCEGATACASDSKQFGAYVM